jgi:hypothetical protein
MSSSSYVPLGTALAWIAFGDWTDGDTPWSNYTQAKRQLEDALERFLGKASEGVISVRGRLAESLDADPIDLDTSDVPATRFHDLRQYDLTCVGLRRGEGLLGFPEEGETSYDYVHRPIGRHEFYRDVLVSRDDLVREFPASAVGPKATHQDVVRWCREWQASDQGGQNKAWPVFSKDPRFKGLSRDDCFRPAWGEAKRSK